MVFSAYSEARGCTKCNYETERTFPTSFVFFIGLVVVGSLVVITDLATTLYPLEVVVLGSSAHRGVLGPHRTHGSSALAGHDDRPGTGEVSEMLGRDRVQGRRFPRLRYDSQPEGADSSPDFRGGSRSRCGVAHQLALDHEV